MPWTAQQRRAAKLRAKQEAMGEPYFTVSQSEREAMSRYLDNLASVLTMIRQRQMDPEQLERCARLLQEAERDLLRRLPRARRKAA